MAIKDKLQDVLNPTLNPQLSLPDFNKLKDLFKPDEVLSDANSVTVLKTLQVLGFHTRHTSVEKRKQKDGSFEEKATITVPADTKHIVATVEQVLWNYGEIKIKNSASGFVVEFQDAHKEEISAMFVFLRTIKIGEPVLGGGTPPQFVRKADISVNFLLHSGKLLPEWSGVVKSTWLFLG